MIGPPRGSNLEFSQQPLKENVDDLGVHETKEMQRQTCLYVVKEVEHKHHKNELEAKHLEVIEKIEQKILEAKLEKFFTVDIQRLDFSGYRYICDNIRDEFGHVDWQYVKDNFCEEVAKKFKFRKRRNFESAIAELRKMVKSDNLKIFSPVYVEENNPQLYDFFKSSIKNEEREIDWNRICNEIKDLDCEFQLIFQKRTPESIANEIDQMLKEKNEKFFSPSDLENKCPKAYEYFRNNFKAGYGFIDWEAARKILPDNLAEGLRLPKDYFKRKYIAKLNDLILKFDNEVVTSSDLREKNEAFFRKIRILFRDEDGNVDWHGLAKRLSPDAKKKFKFLRTNKSALEELNDLLKNSNEKKINPELIYRLNRGLQEYITRHFKDEFGRVNWPYIVKHLDPVLRERFHFQNSYHRNRPKESYENREEVDEKIAEMKEYLYTFLQANSKEDYEKRDRICKDLIGLARKGNIIAEKELINYISFLTEKWQEKIPEFKIWKFYKDDQYDVIMRCIYNFKEIGPFIGYVYKVFKMKAKGLERIKEFEYDDGIGKGFI